MPRRSTRNLSGIRGGGNVNYQDVYRVLECGRPGCAHLFKVPESDYVDAGDGFVFVCPLCHYANGPDLIGRAPRWKYCRVCEWLQPMTAFHRHSGMRSGYQMECRHCKNTRINPRLNPLRTPDQHRESSERRRLYGTLADEQRIDSISIMARFDRKCFNCQRDLGEADANLDHTLPVRFLWPLSTGPTLLCADCNGAKAEKWPSEFYREPATLQRLARLTGIRYEVLAGPPMLNPAAIAKIVANVDRFIERWIRYPDEVKRLRRLILSQTGRDIFATATVIPDFLAQDG